MGKLWERTLIRFLCVGSFNTLLDFTVLNLLVEVAGLPQLVANTCSVSLGLTISYFLNHRLVFRHPQKYSLKSYLHFMLVSGLGIIIIQNSVLYIASRTSLAHTHHLAHLLLFNISDKTLALNCGKAVAVLVGMVWNFLFYKYVVFRHKDQPENGDSSFLDLDKEPQD
jgi:putative flippase GtrA